MSFAAEGYKVKKITHGADNLGRPVDGIVRMVEEYTRIQCGVEACDTLVAKGVEAVAIVRDLNNKIPGGEKATLEFFLEDADGRTVVVSVAGMRCAGVVLEYNFDDALPVRRISFEHDGEMSESPITTRWLDR